VSDRTHVVQLFDTIESRGDSLFVFVRDGLLAGDAVVVVATAVHRELLRQLCRERGVEIDTALAEGSLTLLDAHESLARIMSIELPDWVLFNTYVGALLRRLGANSRRLRIYGEMVDVLARAGEYHAARVLEEYWNRLQQRESFALFCGYSSEHFGNARERGTLRHICRLHTAVRSDPRDILGDFLLRPPSAC
jgi:KaiC/GvpD/RAD55 family RecA-like ATPase